MANAIYRFFVKKNYLDLMLSIYFDKITKLRDLAKRTGMDYAHLSTVSQALEQDDLITREMKHNSFNISLTKKGEAFCLHLVEIKKFVESYKGKSKSLDSADKLDEQFGSKFEQSMNDNFNHSEDVDNLGFLESSNRTKEK